MEVVASELNLSSRTLRRHLEEQGSSFRQLQEEVRLALAEELLAIGSLSQEDIAARLGYSEVSNFLHAFKRWKGQTPGQYRQTRTATV
jgi:AraC-like DNA-binding protein